MRRRGPTKEEELQELQRRYALLGPFRAPESCVCRLRLYAPLLGCDKCSEAHLHAFAARLCFAEGDRKAYYETSQWTIKQNRETLAAVKVCAPATGSHSAGY